MMNGMNGHYGQPNPNPWQEYKSEDGRVYYYNKITKATQWTKPEDLMSPAEVCHPTCPYIYTVAIMLED